MQLSQYERDYENYRKKHKDADKEFKKEADYIGINLPGDGVTGKGAIPTANFHTNGTVRFQNLPSTTSVIYELVIDGNGYVYKYIPTSQSLPNTSDSEISVLKQQISTLQNEVNGLKDLCESFQKGTLTLSSNQAILYQNVPNPSNNITTIQYYLPSNAHNAKIQITNSGGTVLQQIDITGQIGTKNLITINSNQFRL